MPHIEGAGVELHYEERGAGPPLLVIHAMASSAAAWSTALDELAAAGARAIAYDRRGYGASGAPEPYTATTVQEQSEDAGALLAALDAQPALLLGDGFGALVALELLVRRPRLALAAVLADPPLYAYVPAATEALAEERRMLEQALRDGGAAGALRAWLAGQPAGIVHDSAATGHAGFFADYGGQASWSPSRRELRAIGLPVAVVTGPSSPAHVVAAADAAAALLPAARRLHDGDAVAAAVALMR
jgi:pimeloyl-ACP methyl ester carboxylesterase